MGLKETIARWLAPELARNADRYWFLSNELGDVHRWLGEFEDVRAVIDWLLVRERNHWRKRDEPEVESKWHWNMPHFREQLRRRRLTPNPSSEGEVKWTT